MTFPCSLRCHFLLPALFLGGVFLSADMSRADGADLWALEGRDPVSFFEDGAGAEGRSDLLVRFRGRIYHFATEDNQQSFEANPRGYLPQFGGLCATALAKGQEAPGDPDFFAIYDGQLYLMDNAAARAAFLADPAGVIAAAKAYLAGR